MPTKRKAIAPVEGIKVLDDMPAQQVGSVAVMPEDLRIMYAGKMADELLQLSVAFKNKQKGFLRSYGEIYPKIEEIMDADLRAFLDGFDAAKKYLTRITKAHELSENLCQIKGFTPYQLALIMSHIKDIGRFNTPAQLCVYAGVAPKHGMAVVKRNIIAIREKDMQQHPEKETQFGYNTRLQGRMYIIVDSLMRAKGYFYNFYTNTRERLIQRAINEGSTFVATLQDQQDSGGIMKEGERYMLGKKNQSLRMWSHANARWRVARTLLHLIYTEWRTLRGLPVRDPYPIEYLGHSSIITLDEVIAWEAGQKKERIGSAVI